MGRPKTDKTWKSPCPAGTRALRTLCPTFSGNLRSVRHRSTAGRCEVELLHSQDLRQRETAEKEQEKYPDEAHGREEQKRPEVRDGVGANEHLADEQSDKEKHAETPADAHDDTVVPVRLRMDGLRVLPLLFGGHGSPAKNAGHGTEGELPQVRAMGRPGIDRAKGCDERGAADEVKGPSPDGPCSEPANPDDDESEGRPNCEGRDDDRVKSTKDASPGLLKWTVELRMVRQLVCPELGEGRRHATHRAERLWFLHGPQILQGAGPA